MNSQRIKTINYSELIPKLVTNSNDLSTEIKNRIKLNHLFSEFEIKASNQFNFFIKESEKRHKGSKSGAKMDYLLKASKKRGQKEAYKILNDKFYLDKDLIKERKKMLKKSTNEVHNNITDIINKIKGISKTNTNYYNIKKSNYFSKKIKSLNDDILSFKDNKFLNSKKNEINNIFNKEQNKINNFFNSYKTYLSEVDKHISINTENNGMKKIYNKTTFNLPNMQLLNYTKSTGYIRSKKEIDNENRINMKKIIQYSVSKKEISAPIKNANKKFYLTNPNDIWEMKNTNNLVVQKALNEYNSFGNKIMDKNETLRDKLGIDKIPSLKEYENLIKNKFNKIKRKRRHINGIIYEKQKNCGMNRRDLLINKIEENLNFLNCFEKGLFTNKNLMTI